MLIFNFQFQISERHHLLIFDELGAQNFQYFFLHVFQKFGDSNTQQYYGLFFIEICRYRIIILPQLNINCFKNIFVAFWSEYLSMHCSPLRSTRSRDLLCNYAQEEAI